jgi:single-strand DNA-binding protein
MGSLNKVQLIGNLGKDPEVRAIPSGAKVANFSIATTETYTGKDGQKSDKTEWHNIVLWRGLADIAEKYLRKGSQVYIEGKLQTRSWDDKDGQKRYTTEIIADNLVMLGKASGDREEAVHRQGYQNPNPTYTSSSKPPEADPNELPF